MTKELPKELMVLTHTHQLLSEARTFQDFKAIRNKAELARLYAKSAQLGLEVQIYAAELKLECERRAGSAIRDIELTAGGRPRKINPSLARTSLEDLGIKKNQSSRWQQEAQVPEDVFQRYLAESRAIQREPTSEGLLRLANEQAGEGALGKRRHTKKRSRRQSSQPMILDSPSAVDVLKFKVADEQDAIVADLQSHHKQLADILAEYCGTERLVRPKPAQRHYVGRILKEMGEFLAELRASRHEEKGSRRALNH